MERCVESLGKEIPELLAEHKLPGLAVGICQASGDSWSAGFGTARVGHKQPIRTSTMFSVQSVSKMYTAAAVMLAVQQGLVDLDEPITSYLPEFTVESRFEIQPRTQDHTAPPAQPHGRIHPRSSRWRQFRSGAGHL